MVSSLSFLAIVATGLIAASSAMVQPYGYMGSGMMGGYRHGPGMMGGYGSGMMWGGGGMGYGSQWGYGSIPNLTKEQRGKIENIQENLRSKQWALMRKMHDECWNSGSVYRDGQFDEQAARKHFEAMNSLRKKMFENALDAMKRIDSVLTPEQRKSMR